LQIFNSALPSDKREKGKNALRSHKNNRTKLSVRHRHDGEARLAHKLNFLQPGSLLDLVKRDRAP
jgi:hypothetical protein